MSEQNHIADAFSNALGRMLQGSLLYNLLSHIVARFSESAPEARTVQATSATQTLLWKTTTQSYLYRWLTAEPDPEVIVIDLRETWTVGPLLQLLTAAVEWIYPYWQNSICRRVGSGFRSVGNYFVDSRVGTVFAKALAPPQDPETNTEEDPEKE